MGKLGAYDHIISLGHSCRLSHNLRRTFGITRAQPFDWWMTPLAALAAFLKDPSIERLYAPELLRPAPPPGGEGVMTIENVHYDIQLFHDFPREPKSLSVVDDWREHLPAARDRTRYLLDRMLGLPQGERVLFVRHIRRKELAERSDHFLPLADEIQVILHGLFPRHEFDLLFIDPPADVQSRNVFSLQIRDPANKPWDGTPALWSEKLLGAGIRWTGRPAGQDLAPDTAHGPVGESAAGTSD